MTNNIKKYQKYLQISIHFHYRIVEILQNLKNQKPELKLIENTHGIDWFSKDLQNILENDSICKSLSESYFCPYYIPAAPSPSLFGELKEQSFEPDSTFDSLIADFKSRCENVMSALSVLENINEWDKANDSENNLPDSLDPKFTKDVEAYIDRNSEIMHI